MPIHDWTRVIAGVFHGFHNSWITHLKETLNGGVLPAGYYSLSEQQPGLIQPDVLTLGSAGFPEDEPESAGVAVAEAPPKVAITERLDESRAYARKRKTIAIRHRSGDETVALIEIVSAANKDRAKSVEEFVEKAYRSLRAGLHLLVIDLFSARHVRPARHPRRHLAGLRRRLAARGTARTAAHVGPVRSERRSLRLRRADRGRQAAHRDAPLPTSRPLRQRPLRTHLHRRREQESGGRPLSDILADLEKQG